MLIIAAGAAVIGLAFGIVVLAPRLGRLLDRTNDVDAPNEEPRDRLD